MARLAAGDQGAFDELVEEYSETVYRLVTRFLGRDHPSREDLVQEVFLRIFRARMRYTPTAMFTTWLYSIAFRICVNETEKTGRRPRLVPVGGTGPGGQPGPSDTLVDAAVPDPSAGLERGDVVQAVRAAIAELPDSQRLAIVLSRYEGLSHAEIGGVLGSSAKAVKSLVHRARETLRERLQPFMEDVDGVLDPASPGGL